MKIFPGDAKLTEALRNAQVALKKSQVENVARMITGSEVKEITAPKQFQEAISVSGKLSIVSGCHPNTGADSIPVPPLARCAMWVQKTYYIPPAIGSCINKWFDVGVLGN